MTVCYVDIAARHKDKLHTAELRMAGIKIAHYILNYPFHQAYMMTKLLRSYSLKHIASPFIE